MTQGRVCPSCAAPAGAKGRFCGECGAALPLVAPAVRAVEPVGERRQIAF